MISAKEKGTEKEANYNGNHSDTNAHPLSVIGEEVSLRFYVPVNS